MNPRYDHKEIEKKWQDKWEKNQVYKTTEGGDKPKFYILDMFPYPSGEGLHVGHPKGYIATDVVSRMKRMQGFNVLHPMGFDAFGLPAEQYAIKTKTNPKVAVEKNVARYKKQLEILGLDYDWSREVNTTDPKYYKWTQWIFLKLLEKGLAYESYEPINWCPVDKTGLANEDVEDGKCERCGAVVEKRPMRQWVLRITDYADRMLEDLDSLDWPQSIKESQRNWIGRSEGAEFDFKIKGSKEKITVFTTRADTIFGVTYVVLAPEYRLVEALKSQVENKVEVEEYIKKSKEKTDIERTDQKKEKTGVELQGVMAINPANGEEVPVWIADYVLADYGTGAVMAVPAHDDRDAEFAKVYSLPVKQIELEDRDAITQKYGRKVVKYKLRDWVFSRQRYWGEPIPVLHDKEGKVIPMKESDLPLELPPVEHYEPTDNGESPLANISEWVNQGDLRRETNTMPQWAGSSWYYLRYMDPENSERLVDPAREKYWNQVDLYVGGAEHATRHLIYARFWHKFLYDIGVVSTNEPFKKLQHVGLIMAEDGRKMSKRWGNVINPDDIVERFGADSLRLYEMFMGPFDQSVAWSTDSIVGCRRFVERVWKLKEKVGSDANSDFQATTQLHQTIKKVGEDIESMNFNTAISSMMILLNALEKEVSITDSVYKTFLKLLAPFAPHVAEELWSDLGEGGSIHTSSWPQYDSDKLQSHTHTIVVQVNGKVRGEIVVEATLSKEEVISLAKENEDVKKWIKDAKIVKEIYVPGRLVSIVLG